MGGSARAQAVLLSPGEPWTAPQVSRLADEITGLLGNQALQGGHIGFYAIDTQRGTVLYSRAPDEAFTPASTLKTITGSAAIARLGTDFRFHTSVTAQLGAPDTIDGDVVVHGGGDPLLRASDLDAAAAAIAARGIRTIDGGVAIDASTFDDVPYAPGWMMEDVPYDFSAIVSGLMLDEDVVTVHVAASTIGAPATIGITPLTSSVAVENGTVTGAAASDDTLDVARDGAAIRVVGSIPAGKQETIAATVPNPAAFAADVFARALMAHGVTFDPPWSGTPRVVSGLPAPSTAQLWTHDSDPLPQVLKWFWFHSDNLVGEALLKTIGIATQGAPGTTANGVAYETTFLRDAGVDPSTLAIVDGSGLSRYDACTPRAYVTLLQADWNGPNRQVFLDALPTSAEGRVYAKTGSMTHVWNMVGYIMTRRHGPVTFAITTDDFVGNMDTLHAVEATIFSRVIDG